jgi:hypothetical protein
MRQVGAQVNQLLPIPPTDHMVYCQIVPVGPVAHSFERGSVDSGRAQRPTDHNHQTASLTHLEGGSGRKPVFVSVDPLDLIAHWIAGEHRSGELGTGE